MKKEKKIVINLLAVLLFVLAGFGYVWAQQGEVYYLTVDYVKDNYSVQSIDLVKGGAPDYKLQVDAKYRFELVSATDEILYSANFDLSKKICQDVVDSKQNAQIRGCRIADQGNFSLAVPYYPAGNSINLYDSEGKTILQADVSDFARICQDDICQENENALTCPQDCKSGIKDNVCDRKIDGVCDSDCEGGEDQDCAALPKENNFLKLIVIGGIFLVLAVVAVFAIRKMRGRKDGQEQ